MISLDSFIEKVKNNELQVIPRGTGFKMLDRIDINPNIENPKAEKFNSWIGREGVLDVDIYVGEYPILEEGEQREFLLSEDYISLHAKLKFDNKEEISGNIKLVSDDTIFTSNIKSATYNTGISIIETENSIYVLDIYLVDIKLAEGKGYLWDYTINPHILLESYDGVEKSKVLESIRNDIEYDGFFIKSISGYTDKNIKMSLEELLERKLDDKQLFLVIDGLEVLINELELEKELEKILSIGGKLNISLVCGSKGEITSISRIKDNYSIIISPMIDYENIKNHKWILNDGKEEKIVEFPTKRSEQ